MRFTANVNVCGCNLDRYEADAGVATGGVGTRVTLGGDDGGGNITRDDAIHVSHRS